MTTKEVFVALEGRPWIFRALEDLTGAHPVYYPSHDNWEKFVRKWVTRNVSEVNERPFSDINLADRVSQLRYHYGPKEYEKINRVGTQDYLRRRHEAFLMTHLWLFTHITEHSTFSEKCSMHFRLGGEIGLSSKTLREEMATFQDLPVPGIGEYGIDAVLKVTQVGVSGRCSTCIVDLFMVPEDFNPS